MRRLPEPLRNQNFNQAVVLFQDAGDASIKYQGNFDEEGNYKIQVPPGKYKVGVVATQTPKGSKPEDEYALPKSIIHPNYTDPSKSGIQIDVSSDAPPENYIIKLAK